MPHPTLPTPKNWEKEKRFQRKCVTLWGRLTASTKLKYALRQPFAQQKQQFTPRIQRLGSRASNKGKEKNDET